jgi:hypothetical protein
MLENDIYAPGSELPGGYINPLVRIGDTVRRPRNENSEFVEELLRHFEACGFEGAPRFLGIDEQGRQVLSYIEGHVAWEGVQPPGVWTDESLIETAKLVRRVHDLTAGTTLAGACEVVCHSDLSPRNTVYRDAGAGYRPVAFIDWENAAPGERARDLAYMFWEFLCPCPKHANIETHARRINAMLDAYGFKAERAALIGRMVEHMRGCVAGIEAKAQSGDAAYVRLVRLGAIESIIPSSNGRWRIRRGLKPRLTDARDALSSKHAF